MQVPVGTLLDGVPSVLRINILVGSTGVHAPEDELIVLTNRPNNMVPQAIATTLRHATAHDQGIVAVECPPEFFFNVGPVPRNVRNLLIPGWRLPFRQVGDCIGQRPERISYRIPMSGPWRTEYP